jgi:histidinol-phosphatase (PHP family)
MAPFHFILGSVHYHLSEYRERFDNGDDLAFQRKYFEHLADAAETGLFDCISHPDLVKNAFPRTWDFRRVEDAVAQALDRIRACGVAMELNTSGLQKSLPEMNPGPAMLRLMRERGIPIVLGSDSHHPRRVAADFEPALDALEAAGYTSISRYAERRRIDQPIEAVRASILRQRRPWPAWN